MPHRDWIFRIDDILAAISAVQTYVIHMSYADFDEILQSHPAVPWSDMRAMRNFVVHEYFGVSDKILWDTVQINLPPLVTVLSRIRKSL